MISELDVSYTVLDLPRFLIGETGAGSSLTTQNFVLGTKAMWGRDFRKEEN